MLNQILDIVYGTKRVVKKFQANHPNERIVAASPAKGVKSSPQTEVNTGAHWFVARRAVAILTDQRIKHGNWDIPLSSIEQAELIRLRGLISKAQVLNLVTKDQVGYQFGMQMNPDWLNSETLKLEYLKKKIKISKFSWLMRVVLVLWIAYWLYQRFLNH